jgi:hypothetical protein
LLPQQVIIRITRLSGYFHIFCDTPGDGAQPTRWLFKHYQVGTHT